MLAILSTQEIAEKSYLVVPFVGMSILFFGVYTIVLQVLILKKRTAIIAKIWFVAAALNFLLNMILIPKFGIIGAAITTLIAYTLAVIATIKYSIELFVIKFKVVDILKSLLSALVDTD